MPSPEAGVGDAVMSARRRRSRLRLIGLVTPGVLLGVWGAQVWQSPGLLIFGTLLVALGLVIHRACGAPSASASHKPFIQPE